MSRFTVIVDANVLVPAYTRDLVLEMAHQRMFRARWTPHIEDEVRRTLVGERYELPPEKVTKLLKLMHANVLQPMVVGYEHQIGHLSLPDPDDEHVLAAAIASEADTIVTFNLKHFPRERLSPHGVEAVHPDDFLATQIDLDPGGAVATAEALLRRMKQPPLSLPELLDRYRRNSLVHTATRLDELLQRGGSFNGI